MLFFTFIKDIYKANRPVKQNSWWRKQRNNCVA